jgi:Lon-like ATP-dependent protease
MIVLNRFRRFWRKSVLRKATKVNEPLKLSREKILADMAKLQPRFDLRDEIWRKDPERFWREFGKTGVTTDDIRVPEKFKDWIIGQDEALRKIDLILLEWVKTLKDVQVLELKQEEGISYSKILKERPPQNVLLLGEPGTGKSLTIKVVAEQMKELYVKEGIELEDVVLVENKLNKYSPYVRYVKPAGTATKLKEIAEIRETIRGKRKNGLIYGGLGGMIAIGVTLMALGIRQIVLGLIAGFDFETTLLAIANAYFAIGASLVGFPAFILIMIYMSRGGGGGMMGGMGSLVSTDLMKTPNVIVDNNPDETEMWEDVTMISDGSLFGEIEWEAFGTSGKPPYARVQAGKVHKAHKKILYIDEIKNLQDHTAIKLLTAMEDGEMPIQGQQGGNSGGASGQQNVSTPPVKAMFFLFAAGNLDMLEDKNSIINRMPALRDRFENYGDIIMLRDEVEATPLNELLVAQVIRDELYRFQFPPMEAEGVAECLKYIRRRATDKHSIKLMFRAIIKVLKKSSQLCYDNGDTVIRLAYVKDAIENFTASIEQQLLENDMLKTNAIKILDTKGSKVGIVNGLAVAGEDRYHQGAGQVLPIESWVQFVDDKDKADYIVTGIVKEKGWDVEDSVQEVRTAINRMYGIDIKKQCYVHIKFSQTRADGPSAGITMTLALMSWLGDPKDFKQRLKIHLASGKLFSEFESLSVPIRQDIAVTGALQIREETKGDVRISAIGGVDAKIRGANRCGIHYVILPKENYDQKIMSPKDYNGTIPLSASTVLEYWEMIRGDRGDRKDEN